MSFEGVHLMRERVWITPFIRQTGPFPSESYDTLNRKLHRARVERKPRLIRRPSGEETRATATAWIHSPERAIVETDRIELPDGTTPDILLVDSVSDARGRTRQYKVIFGLSRRTG